ncbi:helix-turn-helix domain-containing protein [Robiginitomaculum antarcticum]|uniref:helix-turn-helix domain-containing protein n=1 Tax=Robiginitomaculum antarcticum TaxID=437507 RepID=UPI00036D6468|nr:XRE family transcriptional regulator [Robiginitomaculum antarcticum]
MSKPKRQKNAACSAIGAHFGATISRLRQAEDMSLGDLSEHSGVAKSLISKIEKNESNPTLATITRLSVALGTTVEAVLSAVNENDEDLPALIEHAKRKDIPLLSSDDGLVTLKILGSIDTVEFVQWYDFLAQPGGQLQSSPHPAGSIENLSILSGHIRVDVAGEIFEGRTGETLRYRADRPHCITNIGNEPAHASMVNILAKIVR